MTPAARLSGAIDLLCAIQNAPFRPADATANNFFRDRRYIGGGDRRFISTLIWDVLRGWRRLHWHLRAIPGERNSDISPRLLCAAQLIFSGQEWGDVRELFSGDRYAPQSLTERETAILKELSGKTLSDVKQPKAVKFELPDWVLPYFEADFGEKLEEEMSALLTLPTLDLRVNLLKTTREKAKISLRKEGFEATETQYSPWGLRLRGRHPITSSRAFQDGLIEIQDEGSQLIAAAVEAKPGQRVLDYCAGAGGKTLALAMTMENKGQVIACDVSQPRLEGAIKRLRRAGVHNVTRHLLAEGDKWVKRREASFDTVLVDAPCSGTGTWRRNPDARLRFSEQDLKELTVKQAKILKIASKLVRPGGRLVYATCSLLSAENDKQRDQFLTENDQYELAQPEEMSSWLTESLKQKASFSLTPAQNGTDGFFVSVFKRKA
ncbi:RsmB/NOP family class I SAM-dependent RNA methyltransferase [Aristophania vespae]|uniref:RsmB/NOP family class I SAM-dependent RNA methyltransferase n=1 Tax=Aristophania vespae TaxID=2697033 RepID=UPI002351BB5B|nr:RsmB/NOP family class I SAM-dependent RNA methyltransferase [Aristophania vespae]UMM64750.1 Ribosomal RNA small subunit methyltransferase B [Aristophania vespae]